MAITLAACTIIYPWNTDIVGSKRIRSIGYLRSFSIAMYRAGRDPATSDNLSKVSYQIMYQLDS